MKLLRRGATARRKMADVGSVGAGGPRRRPTAATTGPPRVTTVSGAAGTTWSPLDYLRSMRDNGETTWSPLDYLRSRSSYKLYLLVAAGNLFVCVVLAVALNSSTSDPPAFTDPLVETPPPEKDDPSNTLPGGHRIITRQQWGGRPARSHPTDEDLQALAHPTPYVVISHTAGGPCFDVMECSSRCREIQDGHMGGPLSLPDIAPNFLAGGDGNVYLGRGWAATNPHSGLDGRLRRTNIEVSFIGNFESDEPTKGQLNAALELLRLGVKLGKLSLDYKLFSHNDTDSSVSPGINIFIKIKDWPHFTLPTDDAST